MSKNQINLPKTAFSMKANLPIREPEILKLWKKIDLYKELRNSRKGEEKFVLHDGPPYANGNIHMGTALNKILKDIIVKFHQMDGKDSVYVPGWDCHGLPIEWKIEEQYKKNKKNKNDVPIVEFRKECRTFAEKKVPIEVGEAGDIVVVAGLERANVADTICDLEVNEPIEATPIDPPTMSITITVNTSPLAGTEGKKLTSTQIRDRLVQEAQNNVGITFTENEGNDSFVVSGRGELMLEILLTQMRREGFEMTVSPPKVLYKKDENGNKLEPIEEITMDLDEEHSSKIIDSMNRRKGKLIELKDTGKNKKRLIFHAPTRGLMGYTSRFLTLTKGNGVINRIFHEYGPFEGEMEGRRNGALISMEQGKAVAFAIFNLQARGEMFVTHNDPVYPGMIVGLSPKPGDMIINVMKGKKLTNMRTQGTDENVVLTPVRKMSIAEQLSMLNTDEALEITPESCRLRKAILDPHERKRSEKSGAAA